MRTMPRISVIVPVYNAEKWLRRCIDSILAQTFTDFEVLLVDDGSTDGSGAICDEYATQDQRVRVFHKPNGGVSSARNLGLDNAHGDRVTFCDADDWVDRDWLENLVNDNTDECDLISCGFHTYKKDGSKRDICMDEFSGSNRDYLDVISIGEMFGSLCNKLFKKSIIDEYNLRLDVLIKFREDEEFVLRYITHCSQCRIVSKALYHYYVPDWNKYSAAFSPESGLYLLSSLRRSCRVIGLKNSFTRKVNHEWLRLLLSCIKRHPRYAYKYLKFLMD